MPLNTLKGKVKQYSSVTPFYFKGYFKLCAKNSSTVAGRRKALWIRENLDAWGKGDPGENVQFLVWWSREGYVFLSIKPVRPIIGTTV